MKSMLQKVLVPALLCCVFVQAFSQVDIKVYQQTSWLSLDTVTLTIDPNDNSGTGATNKLIFFNIYNLSSTQSEAFYLEAEWLCSNSSVHYQFCQEYPSDYTTGTCHTFHREGTRVYDDYDYSIPPDTCSYNYLRCHFYIYDYSVEQEHEKICRFSVKRKGTREELDSMYLVVRRGNRPCAGTPTGIHTAALEGVADIYPNPARNFITIAAKEEALISYALYTPDGKTIWNGDMERRKSLDLDVSDLSNGIYFLKLTGKSKRSFYRKIVVDH